MSKKQIEEQGSSSQCSSGESSRGPVELRRKDDKLSAILRDPEQDLFHEALPIWNSLPTDSSGANCYAVGGKMLYNGFPAGSVVCWAWGAEGEPEWRRWDHESTASVTCVAAANDGSYASGCNAGRICYKPIGSSRTADAQQVDLAFFRGCRVIDKHRIGTVALTAEMSTSNDLYGASFRIRWDGEDNLDEIDKDLALKILKHYFTVCSLLLTTHKRVFGGDDDRPMVIVGTINGALLAYRFSHHVEGVQPPPAQKIFAMSPFYLVDGLQASVLNDAAALRALSIDGPPITSISLSGDETEVLLVAAGRSDDDSAFQQSKNSQLLQIDLKRQVPVRNRVELTADPSAVGLRSLGYTPRTIVGFSKAAFYLCGSQLWCWQYGTAPHRMSHEATGIGLALSDDAQWLATGHSDNSVCLWGPLAHSDDCISGNAQWEPAQRYVDVHSMPVQSVAFSRNENGDPMLVSAAADREVHKQRVGRHAIRPPYVANVGLVDEGPDGENLDHVNCVIVCGHKRLCCVAIGPSVQLCSLADLCLNGKFKLLAELKGHDDAVLCMCSNSGSMEIQYLFTGSSDNTARVWKLNDSVLTGGGTKAAEAEVIGPLVSSVTAIVVDRHSASLLYAGLADGSIEIWEWQSKQRLQSLEYHQQPVLSLSTHASKRLVSGSADNTGAVWKNVSLEGKNKCNFELETELLKHDGNVNSVFLGQNRRRIVTASSDCNVLFWDIEAIDQPQCFQGHQAAVTASCTSRDMQTIVSADQSGIVIEWDVISGIPRRSFHANSGPHVELDSSSEAAAEHIKSLVLIEQHVENVGDQSPKRPDSVEFGKWLVIATPCRIRVMRMDEQEYTVTKGHTHIVSCVAMSTDSTVVVSASWDGMLVLWDAVNKTQLMTFKGHLGPVFCCDISDDKRYVFSGSADTNIFIWDCNEAGKKKILAGYHDDPVRSLKKVPAEQANAVRFVTGSTDHKVNLFAMAKDEEPRLLAYFLHSTDIWCVIGPRTVGGYVGIGDAEGKILLWKPNVEACALAVSSSLDEAASVNTDTQLAQDVLTLRYHEERITSVYFSNELDGEKLLATSLDGEASVWSYVGGPSGMRMRKTFTHVGKPAVTVGRFSEKATTSDTLLVVLGCEDEQIYIWDYLSHTIEKVLAGHTGPVCDIEISVDSRVLISAAREQRILRWNLVRGTAELQLQGHTDGVVVAEVSAQSQKVVTGAKDNRIIVWNTVGPSAGKPALDLLLHSGNVSCLALSKSGSQLLSGSWDTTVCFVDLLTPQIIRRFRGHIGAVLSCVIGGAGDQEDIVVSCCRAGRLIRWNLETGKALWNVSLGAPGRCLVFSVLQPSLLLCGCDREFALQVWDVHKAAHQVSHQTARYLSKHKGEISGVVFCCDGRMLCSSDYTGNLVFWDAERESFDVKSEFTCELMESGIESLAVEGCNLACSTRERHVLLFEIDETVGIRGKLPRRVWQHHLGRVPCVRFLARPGSPLKVVTSSYDNRIFIHPVDGGTALWFSWRPVMNAVKNENYALFRHLLSNQRMIVHEKVYPNGWTLLHRLTELGDLKAIQILFDIAGDNPLGFAEDAWGKTPLDIGLDSVQTGILDFLLSQAKRWPPHVLEFSTRSMSKLVTMSLASMPEFLDSRVLPPLKYYDVPPPTETVMSARFSSTRQVEYFEPVGTGGSLVPSLSAEEYAAFGIARTARTIAGGLQDHIQYNDKDVMNSAGASASWALQLKYFNESTGWLAFLMFIVLGDLILIFLVLFADVADSGVVFEVLSWIIILAFAVDIVLRIAADQMVFFLGPHRYTNNFEFIIVVICIISELTKSTLPVSLGRLLRPTIRLAPRLARIAIRVMFLSSAQQRAGLDGTTPISTSCVFLHGVLDHDDGILQYLVTSKQPDLFASTAVRAVLEYKWRRYARSQHLRNFGIFLIFACCWTCYTVATYMKDRDSVERKYKDILAVILVVFGVWYTSREIRKLISGGFLGYVSSGWNLLNLACNSTVLVCVLIESIDAWAFGNDNSTISRELAAVVSPGVWIQSFNYLRGFRGTGYLVRMIQEIIRDIRFFLLIMFIMTIAFTQAFFILEDEEIAPLHEPWEIVWQVYNTAWLGAQWAGYTGPGLQRMIYFVMTFFQLVVLMNLLIAIMGDTFGRVKESAVIEFYRNFAELIYELEMLMTSYELRDTTKFPHYILFSRKETFDGEASGEPPAVVEDAKGDYIRSTIDQISAEIKSLQRNISKVHETVLQQVKDGMEILVSPQDELMEF